MQLFTLIVFHFQRIKVSTSPLSAGGNSPTTTSMHHRSGTDLDSLYGLKLIKSDPAADSVLRSFHLPLSSSGPQDVVQSSSASNLAAMRAAAAAAAAAAATAAGLVLSNSRVRGTLPSAEDFNHVHRTSMAAAFANYPVSPGTSSPSPPVGTAFSRAIVTTAMEALYADRASQLCVDYFPGLGGTMRNSTLSLEPTPSVNLQVTSKEATRSKNGVRAVSVVFVVHYLLFDGSLFICTLFMLCDCFDTVVISLIGNDSKPTFSYVTRSHFCFIIMFGNIPLFSIMMRN